MSGNENADELQARLRAMREGRRAPQASGPAQQQPPTGAPANWHAQSTTDSYNIDDELEELQSMISDGSYLSRPPGQTPYINNNTTNSAMTYTTTSNGTGNGTRFGSEVSMDSSSTMPLDESALWSDHRPTARSYVEEEDTPRGLGGGQQQQQQQQQMRTVARQASYSRGASLPNAPNAHGDVSYESAFRLIQQAADAERNADPLMAIQLYTDAGDLLVRVGKTETDPLLKQGIKEKATEIMKRAEELDQWYYSLQENIRKAALPPQLKIQKTSVPRVQESWHARRPPFSQSEEFTHMRYTAVTTKDPFHFTDDGFQLRVDELQRKVRTFITITMYNEEGSELKGTLTGIARNLQYMCELWGEKAWENVAVAVVSDGRTKASASCLDFLTSIGAFDEEIMTVTSVGVDTQMHLFESTIQLVRDDNFEAYYPPIQLIYALKEHNGGKLNSHLWFFNAFSEQLLPTYTVLVDVGTIPGPDSVYRLVRTMDRNHQIGGVAGEIAVEQPNYFNPVIAAQHFEYKISNIMDKSLESVFGFISVLPGAFSAYRYEAIRAEKGVGPLPEYFRSLTTSTKDLGPFKGNMYLAEDRILCFELLARKGRKWTMHYVKDAIARTDVPETLVDLIKQRRRWLNGSFFAGLFAISNFGRVWKESGHSFPRKCVLTFQFLYLFVQNVLSWFLLSNLFLTFYYVLTLVLYTKMRGLLQGVLGVYSALIGGTVIFALGNKPEKRTAAFYSFSFIFFGLVMAVVSSISIYGLSANIEVKDPREDLPYCKVTNFELTGGVVTALGLVYASAFLHGEFSVLLSTFQYFFMLPTFVNILGIYAYSNLHDLSWGTKGLETATGHGPAKSGGPGGGLKEIVAQQKRIEAEKQRAAREKEDVDNSFRAFRSTLLLFWLVTNAAWVYGMTNYVSSSCYLQGLSYVVAVFNITRFLGAVVFLVFRIVRRFGGPGGSNDGDAAYQANLPPEWQSHYGRGGVSTTGATSLPLPKTAPGQVQIEIASPTAHYREQTL